MERVEVRRIIYSRIEELPTLPAVIPRILSLAGDDRSDAAALTAVIAKDPALSSRLLAVANSAYYGFSHRIAGLDRAVALLGSNMVRSLALSIGVMGNMGTLKRTPHFSPQGLWIHSLATATAMCDLPRNGGHAGAEDHRFVVGLLHDVGKIVFSQFLGELWLAALEEVQTGGHAELHLAERRTIGIDHGEAAGMLLSRWNFPQQIVDPIALHHTPDTPDGVDRADLARLRLADALTQEVGLGQTGNAAPPSPDPDEVSALGISDADLTRVRGRLTDSSDDIRAFYQMMS